MAHLVELFETGRWRRYHSQAAFLENLREAKSAVDTWSMLSGGEVAPDRLEHEESSPKYRNVLPNASFVLNGARLAAGEMIERISRSPALDAAKDARRMERKS